MICMYSSIAFEVLAKIRDLVKSNNHGKQLSVILSIHQVCIYVCMYSRRYVHIHICVRCMYVCIYVDFIKFYVYNSI